MKKLFYLLVVVVFISCGPQQNKNQDILPGRLGSENLALKNDKRLNPQLLSGLSEFGLDSIAPPPPVSVSSSVEERLEFIAASEPLYRGLFAGIYQSIDLPNNVINETRIIKDEDGNEIKLYISKPKNISGKLPSVLHIHGGGMAILTANDPNYIHWRQSLAAKNLIVVGVEFRNIGGVLGNNPFPAGLNDCVYALKWVHQNKEELGISKIIVSGESGGGNLTIATAIKAKEDGIIDYIDGVYAQCPYISNLYDYQDKKLKSLVENDTYFLRVDMLNIMASLYDGVNSKNPLAWPYHADLEMLKGLPPHVISVNELDPLRDEGLEFYNKLKNAGVSARSKVIKGTVHASEGIFPTKIPEIHNSALEDIKNFAYSLE